MIASLFPTFWGPLVSALGNHLWQSTLFAAVAALLTLALRNNRAPVRYWLWFAASAKFLLPFSLLIALGTHFEWIHATAKPTATANTATYFVMQEVSQPFDLITLPSTSAPRTPSRTGRLRAALGGSFVPAYLAAIWLAGFLFVVVRWIRRWGSIAAVLRHAPTLTDGREADALQRMVHTAGLVRTIALKSLPIAIEPGIFGLFRPVLLWPEGISSHLDDARAEARA